MAGTTYALNAGDRAAHDKLLVAGNGNHDIVTFTDDIQRVRIVTDGAAKLYYTLDGSTPTIGGANTLMLPAAVTVAEDSMGKASDAVKIVSAGAPTYSVMAI